MAESRSQRSEIRKAEVGNQKSVRSRKEDWKDGIVEGWKDGIVEGWKDGIVEGWNDGIVEL